MTENNGKSHEISTNQMTSGEIGRNNRESPSNFELEESLNNILSRSHHKSKYNTAMASERYYRVLIIHASFIIRMVNFRLTLSILNFFTKMSLAYF